MSPLAPLDLIAEYTNGLDLRGIKGNSDDAPMLKADARHLDSSLPVGSSGASVGNAITLALHTVPIKDPMPAHPNFASSCAAGSLLNIKTNSFEFALTLQVLVPVPAPLLPHAGKVFATGFPNIRDMR